MTPVCNMGGSSFFCFFYTREYLQQWPLDLVHDCRLTTAAKKWICICESTSERSRCEICRSVEDCFIGRTQRTVSHGRRETDWTTLALLIFNIGVKSVRQLKLQNHITKLCVGRAGGLKWQKTQHTCRNAQHCFFAPFHLFSPDCLHQANCITNETST